MVNGWLMMINDGKLMIKNGDNRGIIVVNDDECMMIFRIVAKPGELQIRIC